MVGGLQLCAHSDKGLTAHRAPVCVSLQASPGAAGAAGQNAAFMAAMGGLGGMQLMPANMVSPSWVTNSC